MEIKNVKHAARLLNRDYVNKGGLYLSKEILWVSLGQRAAEVRAVKVGAALPGSNLLRPQRAKPHGGSEEII